MSQSDTVQVGIIGAGGICKSRHLPGLKAIAGVELVTVCNRSQESSQKVADEWGFADIETDWQKLVGRADIDLVVIGTWPYKHCEMTLAALAAGKHVFCQARMCMNLDEAKKMLAAARAHPKLVNMICPCPWNLEHAMRELVAGDRIGKIHSVELISANGSNRNPNAITWREQRQYSGNQILAMGILAETLNAAVGPYQSLSADFATPLPVKTVNGKTISVDIPQVVTITGTLANGALCVEHHTGLAADKSSVGMRLTVRGQNGTMRYDMGDGLEYAPVGEALKTLEIPQEKRTVWTVEQDLIHAIRQARRGKPWQVRPDFEEGILYMRKVQAVHDSVAAGRAIQLADLV